MENDVTLMSMLQLCCIGPPIRLET